MRPRASDVAPVMTEDEPPSGVVARPEVLGAVPRLAVSKEVLVTLSLNHRAGFIVSFVDGSYTVEMILDACAMQREEALAILGELISRGIVCFG
jgi:hypothetical protein